MSTPDMQMAVNAIVPGHARLRCLCMIVHARSGLNMLACQEILIVFVRSNSTPALNNWMCDCSVRCWNVTLELCDLHIDAHTLLLTFAMLDVEPVGVTFCCSVAVQGGQGSGLTFGCKAVGVQAGDLIRESWYTCDAFIISFCPSSLHPMVECIPDLTFETRLCGVILQGILMVA